MAITGPNEWKIQPRLGVGLLRFGATRHQIDQLSGTYGSISKVHDASTREVNSVKDDEFEAFLKELGLADDLSVEEISSANQLAAEIERNSEHVVDERRHGDFPLSLEYQLDQLVSITTDSSNHNLNFEDHALYVGSSREALIFLQNANGGAKCFQSDVVFDRLGIHVSGHYHQNSVGTWKYYSEKDKISEHRYITIFHPSKIRDFLNEDFVEVDFLEK